MDNNMDGNSLQSVKISPIKREQPPNVFNLAQDLAFHKSTHLGTTDDIRTQFSNSHIFLQLYSHNLLISTTFFDRFFPAPLCIFSHTFFP